MCRTARPTSPERLCRQNRLASDAQREAGHSHHLPLDERLAADAPAPQTDDPVLKMAHTLKTKQGRTCYGQRKCTVEPVFGIIKQIMGFRQFSLRGLQATSGEWKLVALAYNLKRMQVLAAG